jgi:iron-sulfur cluster assembly protein|tara:strand:+ start:2046 stop:2477 length:432 start_codon:yes stop_codon:yes gene_type:complete
VFEGTVEIEPFQQPIMGLLGGEGFSLPVVTETEVVDVNLNFSEAAISALKQNMAGDEESHVLVISAQSGGCSGYLYDMKIIEDPGNDGFQRIDIGGIEVLVHNKDSTMLSGINIDFKETLMGGGFQIENPNADRSCGCGQSFG